MAYEIELTRPDGKPIWILTRPSRVMAQFPDVLGNTVLVWDGAPEAVMESPDIVIRALRNLRP